MASEMLSTLRSLLFAWVALSCGLSLANAAPEKRPPPAKTVALPARYVCQGAFQPTAAAQAVYQASDLWQDAQGRFYVLSLDTIQVYGPDGQYQRRISLHDPTGRWSGGFFHMLMDAAGNFYGVDTFQGGGNNGNRVAVFRPDGLLVNLFGVKGDGDGELYFPQDLALNPQGHLIVADEFNHRLSVWTMGGRWLRNIALPGTVPEPQRLRVDPRGRIFVLDRGLYEFDEQGKFLQTVVPPQKHPGDGGLIAPEALALGPDGCIYVADYNPLGSRILEFAPNGRRLTSIGVQNGVIFDRISGLWVDVHGLVYAADSNNRRLLVFAPEARHPMGAQTTLSPLTSVLVPPRVPTPQYVFDRSFGGDQTRKGWVLFPKSIALGPDGSVYVAGRGGVTRFTADGDYLQIFSEPPRTAASPPLFRTAKIVEPPPPMIDPGERGDIQAITVDRSGNLFAVYSLKPVIACWKADGSPPVAFTLPKRGDYVPAPHAVAADSRGRLYAPEDFRSEIPRYDRNGRFLDLFATPRGPSGAVAGITVDTQDNVFITSSTGNVSKIDPTGKTLWTVGGIGQAFGKLRGQTDAASLSNGIATDQAGNVYVADSGNGRIQKFGPDGTFLTSFGELDLNPDANTDVEKMLGSPVSVAVGADGRVYAANMSRIVVFRPLAAPAKTP